MIPVIGPQKKFLKSPSMVQRRSNTPASCPLPDQKLWKAQYELDMLMLDG
jgi:hypothetical protein